MRVTKHSRARDEQIGVLVSARNILSLHADEQNKVYAEILQASLHAHIEQIAH